LRERTIDSFKKLITTWEWNPNYDISDGPIIVGAHGTNKEMAMKIVSSGFAILSIFEEGFFGKGIYFSSHCIYTFPYFSSFKDPSIIISYILPGNPYPVTELPSGKNSLRGSPILSGYQSHYVVTRSDGLPFTEADYENESMNRYDEIIIGLEAQALPLFVLSINPNNFGALSEKYQRNRAQNPDTPNDSSEEINTENEVLQESLLEV